MNKFKFITKAFIFSAIALAVAGLGFKMTPESFSSIRRVLVLLGGDFWGGGYIQGLTYFAFVWAYFEVSERLKGIKAERRAFKMNIIPTNEKHVFMKSDVHDLKFRLSDLNKKHPLLLIELLKKACFKFRSSESLAELMEIVSIQVEIFKDKAEGDQSTIRYLAWVIPSIGFVGTVLGISHSLSIANSGDMDRITAALGVAFDTTLIALILSIVIMWFVHDLQEQTDRLHSDLKEFVIENLINKIELS